ncbi:MAG: hypothetical protein ABL887_04510, partial [Nitrosomonas sp.]
MNQLDPYHTIAFRLWMDGYDLSILYPSRAFKNHCSAIKAVLGVDVSVPLTSSTNEECLDADAMTSASEEARQASTV